MPDAGRKSRYPTRRAESARIRTASEAPRCPARRASAGQPLLVCARLGTTLRDLLRSSLDLPPLPSSRASGGDSIGLWGNLRPLAPSPVRNHRANRELFPVPVMLDSFDWEHPTGNPHRRSAHASANKILVANSLLCCLLSRDYQRAHNRG